MKVNKIINKTAVSEKKRILCHFPWSSIYVLPNGDVKHCCESNLTNLGNLTEQTIDEIWNGKLYQMVRKKIAREDFDGAYCNPYCQGIRTGNGYPWPEKVIGAKELEANEARAISNFENNVEKVDHLPTQLHLEFSNNCNLRCIMCLYEFKPPYQSIPDSVVKQIMEISQYASTVVLIGGEVFMNKSDLAFIDQYNAQEGAWMGFVSNGTYLNDAMIDRIKKFKRVGIQISIDGTEKKTYEKIRVRGNWEEVDANIQRLVRAAHELKAKGYVWEISLAYVLMRSNFSNLAHSVEYAIKLGVPMDFNPLIGYNFFHENIYVYKDALHAIGDWQSQLHIAYEILERHKDTYKYYNRVLVRLKDIEQLLHKPKIRVSPGFIKLLNFVIPGSNDSKTQGLSKHDGHVGHLMEIYYSWRIGNTSLRSTLSYLILKGINNIRKRYSKKPRIGKVRNNLANYI